MGIRYVYRRVATEIDAREPTLECRTMQSQQRRVADLYRQNRGDEDNENHVSLYYIIRGIQGPYTYRITLGGIEKQFEKKTTEYHLMLSSLAIRDTE